MFCCTLLYVHFSIAIILMGKRELVALLNLSSWCLVMVEWLFLAVPWGCLRFVIVVFPDHTHFLFLYFVSSQNNTQIKLTYCGETKEMAFNSTPQHTWTVLPCPVSVWLQTYQSNESIRNFNVCL